MTTYTGNPNIIHSSGETSRSAASISATSRSNESFVKRQFGGRTNDGHPARIDDPVVEAVHRGQVADF